MKFIAKLSSMLLGCCALANAGEPTLKIETIVPGTGAVAHKGDRVAVHYVGRLFPDTAMFDNSYDRGQPLTFVLGTGQVIQGWDKGIEGMKVGEKRRLVVPSKMAYGERAIGPIPANSTLSFDVELMDVAPGPKPDSFPQVDKFPWAQVAPGVEIYDEVLGQGDKAAPGMDVAVHYTGWLLRGTKFDSSKDRAQPLQFTLGSNQVIRGWELGLPGMKTGGVRFLRIQPSAGYGPNAYASIPPNSVLVFRVELQAAQASENAGDLFPDLTSLAWKDGPEGLRYAVLQTGNGVPAKVGGKVSVHYTGWLQDGQKFDSSRDRNQPFSFPLGAGRVIRGWDLGVEGMLPGEKRILMIPPGLGYGSRGAGPIPGGATLVFAVEYLSQE